MDPQASPASPASPAPSASSGADVERTTPTVTVYWRPGCGFCMGLRRGLERRGVPHELVDVWQDPDASDKVRAVNGGNELVPTVSVGTRWLSNPSVDAVLAAMAEEP